MRHLLALTTLCLLTACGSGNFAQNLNPLNWFGGGSGVRTVNGQPSLAPRRGYQSPVETRALAPSLGQVQLQRTSTGRILKVQVAVPNAGYRGVALVERRDSPAGVLVYEARMGGGSGPATASVTAAIFISNAQLKNVVEIQVLSASNTASLRP